ncbi:Cmr4 family CRISPR-associated RAMP protein [[Clostridium] cellulosi]|uniref:Cmr4 family CRISPR-associated RAMP protein n=1 Tax=[Clostridium] cellulosi TaxID=29343 RepID=A0A078KKV8_9FIRM|nr:Cmr4 family CRISPR-associated RAMP protein [[Clostridium] cellulosi]
MYDQKKVLFLKVLTPLHAGSGTDIRSVDLPIQREVHTGYPKIESSTIKGCLRDTFEFNDKNKNNNNDHEIINAIFGEEGASELSAAAIAITDARLLFFPVRSAKGIYALITCPMVIKRFQNDMESFGVKNKICIPSDAPALASENNILSLDNNAGKYSILLDEFRYYIGKSPDFERCCNDLKHYIGLTEDIAERAVLLPDDDFKDFVTHATSIVTRIKIGNNGVVENKALFTEEYLPEESILYSFIMMSDAKLDSKPDSKEPKYKAPELMGFFSDKLPPVFQIGADATLGKGFVMTYLKGGDTND